MSKNEPIVFIAEDIESDDMFNGDVYSGLFSGHVDRGRAPKKADEIYGVTAQKAISWGRERASRVLIHEVESDYYSAGEEDVDDYPTWPEGRQVSRRRPPGQEWRDRAPGDASLRWAIDVELQPVSTEPRRDWSEAVAGLAREAGAAEWGPGSPRVDFRTVATTARKSRATRGRMDPIGHRMLLHIDAATVHEAMDAAIELVTAPKQWWMTVYGQPLAQRSAPPRAARWRLRSDIFTGSTVLERLGAALDEQFEVAEAVVTHRLTTSSDDDNDEFSTLDIDVTIASPDDGQAEALVEHLLHGAFEAAFTGDEEIGWTRTGWDVAALED